MPAAADGMDASAEARAWALGALLLAVSAVLAAAAGAGAAGRQPGLLVALLPAGLLLDLVAVDVFGRATLSAATVPTLALALLFGPLGCVVAEIAVAATRRSRGAAAPGLALDLGVLALSGSVAGLAYRGLHPTGDLAIVATGALAGAVFFAANTLLAASAMALVTRADPLRAWRELFAWLGPHHLAFGALAGCFVLAERRLGAVALLLLGVPTVAAWLAQRQYVDRTRRGVAELEEANERLRELLAEREALLRRMHRAELQTIASLARTIEAKDPYTGGHTERVSQMALRLARELGFGDEDLHAVEVGAIVHDIGKIGVRDDVLLKPGSLSEEEFAEMRRHPAISSYILDELELPPIVAQMVRSHHERYAGGGYPDGLAGEDIPLPARVLAVADALDAMTSDRPYRDGRTFAAALAEVEREAGSHFCPRVVGALRRSLAREPGFWRDFGPLAPPAPQVALARADG